MNKKAVLIIQRKNDLINKIDFSSCEIENVHYSNNNSGAYYLAIKEKPFLIISDTDVFNIDALALLQDIKLRFLNTYLPKMIIISDTSNPETIRKALNLGVYRFFTYQTPTKDIVTAIKESRDHIKETAAPSYLLIDDLAHKSKRLLAIVSLIQSEYMHNLKAIQVAEELNVSESYVMHTLKNELNKTFTQVLKEVRINEAKKLLATGQYNVKDVAHKVGFNDEKYFSIIFKEYVGITPSGFMLSED